jgi:hypothetical protein
MWCPGGRLEPLAYALPERQRGHLAARLTVGWSVRPWTSGRSSCGHLAATWSRCLSRSSRAVTGSVRSAGENSSMNAFSSGSIRDIVVCRSFLTLLDRCSWIYVTYRDQEQPEVANLGQQPVQSSLIGDRAGDHGFLPVAADLQALEPGGPPPVEDACDRVTRSSKWLGQACWVTDHYVDGTYRWWRHLSGPSPELITATAQKPGYAA